jgi:hypothetical protein
VLLSRWLLTKPQFLILDEPTAVLTLAPTPIIRLIETLCADGLALLVISSELEELVGYADRVIIMRDRQQVAELALSELRAGDHERYCGIRSNHDASIVPKTGQPKRRWPKGMPQIIALLLVLVVDSLVAPHFPDATGRATVRQPDRYFQPRRAGGAAGDWHDAGHRHRRIDLRRGGDGDCRRDGGNDRGRAQPAGGAARIAGGGALAGLWNGILVAVLKIQPFVATLILMVAGRGVAQLITSGQIVTFDFRIWRGSAADRCCCSRRR